MLALAGCASLSGNPETRAALAREIAGSARMEAEIIPAPPFALTAYRRVGQPGERATVYIEGDGLAWLGRHSPSPDPTPTDPVALRLAAVDPAANVIWLARPCQYSKMTAPGACPQKYWMGARLAPEVVASLDAALDRLKSAYRLTGFDLVGFSGGGGAAALLAARRHDVTSLRTVAGNLDHALFAQIHGISPLTESLDPRDVAQAVATIPQIHFVGRNDKVVPTIISQSFRAAAGQSRCIEIQLENASHEGDWPFLWPRLKSLPMMICR